jgi:hypothetical protein
MGLWLSPKILFASWTAARSYRARACFGKQQRLYFFPLPQGQGSFLPA